MVHPIDSEPSQERARPVVDNLDRLVARVGEDDRLVLRYSEGLDIDAENGPSRDDADGLLPELSVTISPPHRGGRVRQRTGSPAGSANMPNSAKSTDASLGCCTAPWPVSDRPTHPSSPMCDR